MCDPKTKDWTHILFAEQGNQVKNLNIQVLDTLQYSIAVSTEHMFFLRKQVIDLI